MAAGYVKLHRSIMDWEWYHDLPVRTLFLHLMVTVNREPGRFMGQPVPAGALATSLESLATASGLSVQAVRTALNKLKSTGEVGEVVTNKFRVVSLRQWAEYQEQATGTTGKQQRGNKRSTADQQQSNSRSTTIREGEKGRRGEGENRTPEGVPQNDLFGERSGNGTPPNDQTKGGPNPGVQAIIDHLKAKLVEHKIAPNLDPTVEQNRRDAWNLLRKMGSDYPGQDPTRMAIALITFATADPAHAPWCTKVGYLFKNCGRIAAQIRMKRNDPRTQSSADRNAQHEQHLAAYRQELAGNTNGSAGGNGGPAMHNGNGSAEPSDALPVDQDAGQGGGSGFSGGHG